MQIKFVFLIFMKTLEYPDNCTSYHGPHNQQCLTNIWIEEGCAIESDLSPENLSPEDMNVYRSMTIRLANFKKKTLVCFALVYFVLTF